MKQVSGPKSDRPRSNKLKALIASNDKEICKPTDKLDIKNWDEDEKVELLRALRIHGSKDLKVIASVMPTKTLKEVEDAIAYYRSNAAKVFSEQKKTKLYEIAREKALHDSLTYWINLLRNQFTEKELHTNLGRAMEIIGECEKTAPVYKTCGVDFHKLNLVIADVLKGETPRELNNYEIAVLKACIQHTMTEAEKSLELVNVDMELWKNPKDVILPRSSASEDVELAAFELLISQRNCNPLGMDVTRLKYEV